jgi:glycosyltransferase involved in cell wall biosynthesis
MFSHRDTGKTMQGRIFFLNRFFYPDHSATSQLLGDLAFHLADGGQSVHVVTSRLRYDDPEARLEPREEERGVVIHRVWTSRFGRHWLPGRAIDYLTFYLAAGWALLRLLRHGDVLVAKTDPPMISVLAAAVARLRGARLVNWLQDLYPEVAVALGVPGLVPPLVSALAFLRTRSLHAASMNVVPGDRMRQRVEDMGVPPERIRVIVNWSDGEQIRPISRSENPLRRDWGLGERFVVGYSGNFGRSHEFGTVLDAAARLAGNEDVAFLFIGGGARRESVEREVAQRSLGNCVFRPYQPRAALTRSLGAADVHLVTLKPELEGLIVPSKIYGVLAAGRPVLFVGDPHGELGELVDSHRIGFSVDPGDAAALEKHIRWLAAHGEEWQEMGIRARELFEARFDRKIALSGWSALLEDALRA